MADWTAKVSPRESYFITRQGSGDRAVMLEERWRTRYMTKSFWSVLHYYDGNSQRSWWCHDFSSEDRLFRCGRKDSRSTDRAILVATVVFERATKFELFSFCTSLAFYITRTVMIMSLTCQERSFGGPPFVENIWIPLEKQRDKIKSVLLSIFWDPSQSFAMTLRKRNKICTMIGWSLPHLLFFLALNTFWGFAIVSCC